MISHSNLRDGNASASCQATICPGETQGRYGSPSALEPARTAIRHEPGSSAGKLTGSVGNRCIHDRQTAELSSRRISENKQEAAIRKHLATIGRLRRARRDLSRRRPKTGNAKSELARS